MDQVVVKTEMNSNEEILLFYVDEDGGNEEGVVTTVQSLDEAAAAQLLEQENAYIINNETEVQVEGPEETIEDQTAFHQESAIKERWTDNEVKRLLVFYTDNKATFLNGSTKKKHLWTVACKTMLTEKNPIACDQKLRYLKKKYAQAKVDLNKSRQYRNVTLPDYDLCHKAFHDDTSVATFIHEIEQEERQAAAHPHKTTEDGIVVVRKVNKSRTPNDKAVELMLELYLKYKRKYQKDFKQRNIWGTIALEMGETDADFLQKRFLNFKQHYIKMLDKRKESGPESISWPYMAAFDKIFEGDEEFHRKYFYDQTNNEEDESLLVEKVIYGWDATELTVLVKYYFDCFQEFQDPTIPKNFLWTEVGRLLDKTPDACKEKFEDLKKAHVDSLLEGDYEMRSRNALAILFDNIIASEIKLKMAVDVTNDVRDLWKTEELDELVQWFYENIELFKDPVCYYVCWDVISKKLRRSLESCRRQWYDLTSLYNSILEDKKEDPDMQIDWRYIELFDRIFDYGMDQNLLEGYEKALKSAKEVTIDKIGVKKVNVKFEDKQEPENGLDEGEYDERGFMKHSKRGEVKAFKILQFYQSNKDKFLTSKRKKILLWDEVGRQIGLSGEQCAHRFRNLKQVYTSYVQREITKPEMPIVWPYYDQCKKVFGYRAIKNKLKNDRPDTDEEDWSFKEIKQLITYLGQNFDEINNSVDDDAKWSNLSSEIGKSESACNDKFLELRKSYRKLRTMKNKNPNVNVSWKYYGMMDGIFSARETVTVEVQRENMDVVEEEQVYEEIHINDEIRMKMQDEDFQCIIVIPEGQDLTDLSNAQIITQENGQVLMSTDSVESKTGLTKWTKKSKKNLLIHYLNYIRRNKGHPIVAKDMWDEVSMKLPNKTPLSCRKMFAKLKSNHINADDDINKKRSPYYALVERVMTQKPRFIKPSKTALIESETCKDVPMPSEKVELALQYYLEHIEEFVNPRFEKKYLWTELANHVQEPLSKVYNKVCYLKQNYSSENDEVAGESTPYSEILNLILVKEYALKSVVESELKANEENLEGQPWSDDEIEQLLIWYLANLDKFKNPKFVRSYLWKEVSSLLNKSPLVCSKKMSEIRTMYRTLVKETPEVLSTWRFYELCQKIYGTGRKASEIIHT